MHTAVDSLHTALTAGIVLGGGFLLLEFMNAGGGEVISKATGVLDKLVDTATGIIDSEISAITTVTDLVTNPEDFGCDVGQEYDAGLCYDACPEGYKGVGPVCWEECGEAWLGNGGSNDAIWCGKGSYGRGLGQPVWAAKKGWEVNGAIQYPQCRPGYKGVGPVCWEECPPGYENDLLTCRRDASIISADNSSCPWYDKCGLTLSKGCAKCPAGYTNDGCTCRRDAHIYGKDSYGRGVGEALQCGVNEVLDGAMCYGQCRTGYYGVGPVCWQNCPHGMPEMGVSCQKRTINRGVGRPIKRLKSS